MRNTQIFYPVNNVNKKKDLLSCHRFHLYPYLSCDTCYQRYSAHL